MRGAAELVGRRMRRVAMLVGRRVRRAVARVRAARQRFVRGRAGAGAGRARARVASAVGAWSLGGAAPLGGTLRIVAHQDDDLLFQSVTLHDDLRAGRPVTTVYLTAGDDDDATWYWRAREAGVRAAYAAIAGVADAWIDDTVTLGGAPVARSTLAAAPRVRLVFLRLPDGGIEGSGGRRSGGASLRRLWEGDRPTLTVVDGSATHTLDTLAGALRELVDELGPDRILTLDHRGAFGDGDHSDHHVAGYLAARVHAALPAPAPAFAGYRGYTIESEPANLGAEQVAAKRSAFFTYARSDHKTPPTLRACVGRPEGLWLQREYEA